jgi:hypothetical protein
MLVGNLAHGLAGARIDLRADSDRTAGARLGVACGVGTTTAVNNRNQYTSFGGESLSYDKNGNLGGLHGSALSRLAPAFVSATSQQCHFSAWEQAAEVCGFEFSAV